MARRIREPKPAPDLETDPKTPESFLALFDNSVAIEEKEDGTTDVSIPCPFCAAPEFIVYNMLAVKQEKSNHSAVCNTCGRFGSVALTLRKGEYTLESSRTGGPELPSWYRQTQHRKLKLPEA